MRYMGVKAGEIVREVPREDSRLGATLEYYRVVGDPLAVDGAASALGNEEDDEFLEGIDVDPQGLSGTNVAERL